MKPNRSVPPSTIIPVLAYPDVREAVDWLSAAFGFEERVRIGENHRSQLSFGEGAVIVADTTYGRTPPGAAESSHSIMVRVENAQAHYERAIGRGATILSPLRDEPFGERQYSAVDLAGHHWTFTETIADVEPESLGLTTVKGWDS